MSGALVLLIVNSAVAGMFALCYFLIAYIARTDRPVVAFGVSYLIGMMTPLSELGVHWAANPTPFMILSYASLLAGFLSMAAAISLFGRERPLWKAILAVAAIGVIARLMTWDGRRDYLPYELAYQFPFVLALLICAVATVRHIGGKPLRFMLAGLFGLIAANFLFKPFVAAMIGSGKTAQAYADSAYALFSQASTGTLLIATGLGVLLIVVQTTVHEHLAASQTDHLSGLLNRRGFDRQAQAALGRAAEADLTVVMIDIDHFKAINDTHGHDIGDLVIRAFSDIIRRTTPKAAIVARTGGEEFVILLERTTLEGARLVTEVIRQQAIHQCPPDLPRFTFSAGVAQLIPDDTLPALLRRADQATYRAKTAGRNRTAINAPLSAVKASGHSGKVVSLRIAGAEQTEANWSIVETP